MEQKLLLVGSIVAVVVLVLAGLSPVVGYNNVESSAKESPLFNVRTKRAIDKDSETLTCNYLRKGQLMSFPARNSKTIQIQKMIDIIKSMDDRTFKGFIELVAHRYRSQQKEMEVGLEMIIAILHQMRYNAEKLYELDENGYIPDKFTSDTPYILCWILDRIIWYMGTFVVIMALWIATRLDKCETIGCVP
jgi:hypothetical protein